MSIATLRDIDTGDALQHIGTLIDISEDLGEPAGWEHALRLCDELSPRLSSKEQAILNYFRANAWGGRYTLKVRAGANSFEWEQPEIEKQILYLRQAHREAGFSELGRERRCQILTNLANAFDVIGRFVESLEYWTVALAIIPSFGMARGNRGLGYCTYARVLFDPGHAVKFLRSAQNELAAVIRNPDARIHPSAKRQFETRSAEINRWLRSAHMASASEREYSLGRSRAEQAYRRWCLANRLFLNPLNDLGLNTIAACDVMLLPSHHAAIGDPPTYISFFNQLKQEFVSARFLYYEGVGSSHSHFSDRDVRLLNTLDYAVHALSEEKVRLAFRAAYSVFDKIALFLNDYLQLGTYPRQVGFRSIWYEPKTKDKPRKLRRRFENYRNLPLRGLFWLAKDLATDEPELQAVIEPDASDLQLIRNHLEHKYLTLHELGPKHTGSNELTYALSRFDFETKTLRVLKLVRAALIYLSLGMYAQERLRQHQVASDAIIAPMGLPEIPYCFRRRF